MINSSIKCYGYANVSSVHRVLITSCISCYNFVSIFKKFHIHTFRIILYLACKYKLLLEILICRIFISILRKIFCYYFYEKKKHNIYYTLRTNVYTLHMFLSFSRKRKILKDTIHIIHHTLVILKVN